MSFLAPWALLLAAAAGVPLLLHLLRRRTGAKLDFPAVRYLLRMEKEHAREVRLKNLLLMVLRVAIVLALAFAAARPVGPLPGVGHAPVAAALVLDNSLSSAAAGAEGPMLGRLTAVARAMIDGASAADRLWIVTMDGAVVGGSPAALRDALSRVRAIDGAGDATAALRRATTLVEQSGIPNGRVVILTDGQGSTWREVAPVTASAVPVTVVQPTGVPPVNRAVASVATEPAHWNPRGAVRATISGADSTTWRVIVDGRTLARGSAKAGTTVLARVQPSARGWVAGAIELAPDELRTDDIRHFAAHIGEPPAIATDAASGLFLRGAVDALVQGGRAVRSAGASGANTVSLVSAERARRPGLLFAPTDPLKLADANRALERAGIPWRYGARRDGPAPLRGAGLDGAVARTWYPLTAEGDISGVDTLARVGGAPWAVAGDGYVLVASAADAAATDLPVRAGFIPWLDELLSQRLAQGTGAALDATPGATVRVPTGIDALEAPDGSTRPVASGATIEAPWTAGVHFWRRGGQRAGALVVNGEARESDLARLAPDSLAALLGASATVAASDANAATDALFAAGGRRTLARTFLALALLLLVAESLVARRGIFRPSPA
ncbi:MAG: BatA domain-containing protein [Gemmatimonadales bacterium]|nr:BatA domain-containing protein [Gemmatimonadales bacterium]